MPDFLKGLGLVSGVQCGGTPCTIIKAPPLPCLLVKVMSHYRNCLFIKQCIKQTLILQDGSGSMDFDEFCEMMMTKPDGPEEK